MASPEVVVSLRALAVLVLLLAGVVGLLVWLGREPQKPPATAPAASLIAFQEDGIRSIAAACPPGTWTLRRDALSGWRVAEPFDAEADPRRVRAVLSALSDATAVRTVAEPGADTAAFGLAPTLCTVQLTVSSDPTSQVLRLGRASPVGSERYALAPDGKVVLVNGSLFDTLSREAESFRERRLFPVEAASLTRIAIDRPGGRLELISENGAWRVVAPVPDAAAATACDSLARAIAGIELGEAGGTKPPIVSRAARRIRVELTSGHEAPRVGFVAAAGIAGTRIAWREGGSPIGLVAESVAKELEQATETFRSKHIATFATQDVRWVAVERGGTSLRVERASDGAAWSGRSGARAFSVDAARVEDFLTRLRQLTAVGFEPVRQSRGATGSIVVGGSSGELCRMAWGPLAPSAGDAAESVWVETPARPDAVFRVLATELGPIPGNPSDWTAQPKDAPAVGS